MLCSFNQLNICVIEHLSKHWNHACYFQGCFCHTYSLILCFNAWNFCMVLNWMKITTICKTIHRKFWKTINTDQQYRCKFYFTSNDTIFGEKLYQYYGYQPQTKKKYNNNCYQNCWLFSMTAIMHGATKPGQFNAQHYMLRKRLSNETTRVLLTIVQQNVEQQYNTKIQLIFYEIYEFIELWFWI